MGTALARLVALLDLERIDRDLWRGANTDEGWMRVYGGQVVAQALAAAHRSLDDGEGPAPLVHSLHGYFLSPGDPRRSIVYRVARERDGRSFRARRVSAEQEGRPIFTMLASFQPAEPGLAHQPPMPPAPQPETLMTEADFHASLGSDVPEPYATLWHKRERPFDFRHAAPQNPFRPVARTPARGQSWFRTDGAAPADDPALAAQLLAYASDMTLLDHGLMPHGIGWADPGLQAASLNHAIWFHAPYRPADWHLYDQWSPAAGGARGLNLAHVFHADGTLVATVAQEGLIRIRGSAKVP